MLNALAPGNGLCKRPPLCRLRLVWSGFVGLGGEMRLIEERHVPLLLQDLVLDARLLRVVDRRDEHRKLLPRACSGGQLPLHLAAVPRRDNAGGEMEKVVERLFPLLSERRGHDHKNPRRQLPSHQLRDDKPRFNGFPESHVVGDKHAHPLPHFQRHHDRHELEVLRDDATSLQAQKRGRAVEHAQPVSPQEKILGLRRPDGFPGGLCPDNCVIELAG